MGRAQCGVDVLFLLAEDTLPAFLSQ